MKQFIPIPVVLLIPLFCVLGRASVCVSLCLLISQPALLTGMWPFASLGRALCRPDPSVTPIPYPQRTACLSKAHARTPTFLFRFLSCRFTEWPIIHGALFMSQCLGSPVADARGLAHIRPHLPVYPKSCCKQLSLSF